jgi:hypothetical protein
LGGGPPSFTPGFTGPTLLWYAYRAFTCLYRAITFFGAAFQHASRPDPARILAPTTPVRRPVWALPLSLAATDGIDVSFFSCGYLDVSVPHVRSLRLCIQRRVMAEANGLPHSEIPGSTLGYQLLWAYRRFPRLSSPSDAEASTTCSTQLDHIDRTPMFTLHHD